MSTPPCIDRRPGHACHVSIRDVSEAVAMGILTLPGGLAGDGSTVVGCHRRDACLWVSQRVEAHTCVTAASKVFTAGMIANTDWHAMHASGW